MQDASTGCFVAGQEAVDEHDDGLAAHSLQPSSRYRRVVVPGELASPRVGACSSV
jgi:hypothetical protein